MIAENISTRIRKRNKKAFILPTSVKALDELLNGALPDEDVFKIISLNGGLSSITFIKYVADKFDIDELSASTLRFGEKQFRYLVSMKNAGKIKQGRFFVSTMQKGCESKGKKNPYFDYYEKMCEKAGWKNILVNNHSKIILMRAGTHHFVLETSSNLNENPKIEQYSFSEDKVLYDFYYGFFNQLEEINER